jgi:S1-C subfamily serine protease
MAIGHAPKQGNVCVQGINSETSPAALAGVKEGWLVNAVAGTPVSSKAEVVAALQALGDDATEVEFMFTRE